jgi:2-amino-4-hydroxy-6-hydroxymethyldihydropteridine diphosphokinase
MARIFLSIGSNIEPELNLKSCASSLACHFTNPVWSPLYRSAAVGMVGDDFLNAMVMIHTEQSIESIYQLLKKIEDCHGRIRSTNKFTNRTLDIDLLLYNDAVMDTPNITLPSSEIITAAYVLIPLVDLAPDDMHPVTGKSYQDILKDLEHIHPDFRTNLHPISLNLAP